MLIGSSRFGFRKPNKVLRVFALYNIQLQIYLSITLYM